MLAALLPALAVADQVSGAVGEVLDGDTLVVVDAAKRRHEMRLVGIDAPALGQPFGQAARQHLTRAAFGRFAIADCVKTDRDETLACVVHVKGVDVGLAQLRSGMAWQLEGAESNQPEEERAVYAAAEAQARQRRDGLWQDPAPIAPWVWRREGTRRAR